VGAVQRSIQEGIWRRAAAQGMRQKGKWHQLACSPFGPYLSVGLSGFLAAPGSASLCGHTLGSLCQ